MTKYIVSRGILGWGNRKAGLEAYGPLGRWAGPIQMPMRSNQNCVYGDLLGDHMTEQGAHEGMPLIVVALPRTYQGADIVAVEERVRAFLATLETTEDGES